MRIRQANAFLAILAAILLMLSPVSMRVVFAWACEGRICGETLRFCCCTAPNGEGRDLQCESDRTQNRGATSAETLCAAGCDCRMVAFRATADEPAFVTSVLPVPSVRSAVLPEAVKLSVPCLLLRTTPAYPVEVRGPPASDAARLLPSLRAPPAF
jgi:hypothetical protein